MCVLLHSITYIAGQIMISITEYCVTGIYNIFLWTKDYGVSGLIIMLLNQMIPYLHLEQCDK